MPMSFMDEETTKTTAPLEIKGNYTVNTLFIYTWGFKLPLQRKLNFPLFFHSIIYNLKEFLHE